MSSKILFSIWCHLFVCAGLGPNTAFSWAPVSCVLSLSLRMRLNIALLLYFSCQLSLMTRWKRSDASSVCWKQWECFGYGLVLCLFFLFVSSFLVEKNFEVSRLNSLILPGSSSHFTWFVSPNMAVKKNSGFHSASTLLWSKSSSSFMSSMPF